jgi:hypothetical protein
MTPETFVAVPTPEGQVVVRPRSANRPDPAPNGSLGLPLGPRSTQP